MLFLLRREAAIRGCAIEFVLKNLAKHLFPDCIDPRFSDSESLSQALELCPFVICQPMVRGSCRKASAVSCLDNRHLLGVGGCFPETQETPETGELRLSCL